MLGIANLDESKKHEDPHKVLNLEGEWNLVHGLLSRRIEHLPCVIQATKKTDPESKDLVQVPFDPVIRNQTKIMILIL